VDSWTGTRWTDLSGYGNHVTEIGGNISVARPVGAPAYIYGATTASMRFPAGVLPSVEYTLFFVARYNGPNRGRIFQGDDSNWLSGFWSGLAGVALHGSCGWITNNQIDMHGYDWVIGTDRSNSLRSNGVDRTPNSACTGFSRLAINTGLPAEYSDFAVQSVLVYNRKLSDAEVLVVEAWLTSLQRAFTPANLQVRAHVRMCRLLKNRRSNINGNAPRFRSLTIFAGRCCLLRRARPHCLQRHLCLVPSSGFSRPPHGHGQRQRRRLGHEPSHGDGE
jgi:hypothetical protein